MCDGDAGCGGIDGRTLLESVRKRIMQQFESSY